MADCPYCGELLEPMGLEHSLTEQRIIAIYCLNCQKVVGVVNKREQGP